MSKPIDSPIIDSRPFSEDPLTGMKKTFHYHADGSWTISQTQDVEPMIDNNKRDFNNVNTDSWKGDMHKVASLPMALYMELSMKGIFQDQKKFRAWLNDPDNRYYRTRAGRI